LLQWLIKKKAFQAIERLFYSPGAENARFFRNKKFAE
jgi:hypothetical protein